MARLLASLRSATLSVVEAALAWRASGAATGVRLVRMHGELRSVPEPLVHDGRNYLLKVLTDLNSLPLPGASDPFLLRWFGKEAPWWHPSYGRLCPPSALVDGSRAGAPPRPLERRRAARRRPPPRLSRRWRAEHRCSTRRASMTSAVG